MQSFKRRWASHRCLLRKGRHENKRLQSDWNEFGESVFTFEVLLVCERDKVRQNEQGFLDELNAADQASGYCLCPESETTRGFKHDSESRAKIRAGKLGKPWSEKQRAALTGRIRSAEERENNAASHRGKKRTPEQRQRMLEAGLLRRGRKMTDEQRAKMSTGRKIAKIKRLQTQQGIQ